MPNNLSKWVQNTQILVCLVYVNRTMISVSNCCQRLYQIVVFETKQWNQVKSKQNKKSKQIREKQVKP